MEFNERVGVKDSVEVFHMRGGQVIDYKKTGVKNPGVVKSFLKRVGFYKHDINDLFTTAGKADVATYMSTGYLYQAIGEGHAVAAAGDTQLGNETHRSAATFALVTVTVAGDTCMSSATFDIAAPTAIWEFSIQKIAVAGTMPFRQVAAAALNVIAGDQLYVVWRLTAS